MLWNNTNNSALKFVRKVCEVAQEDLTDFFAAWGFFEGFNYAVIAEIVSRRHPSESKYFDWGVLVAAIMGILFHPIHFDILGIIDFIVTFIALYGMLIVRKRTGNSWGCVFAFIFIWNAF